MADDLVHCSACGLDLEPKDFYRTQLKLNGKARCKTCMTAAAPEPAKHASRPDRSRQNAASIARDHADGIRYQIDVLQETARMSADLAPGERARILQSVTSSQLKAVSALQQLGQQARIAEEVDRMRSLWMQALSGVDGLSRAEIIAIVERLAPTVSAMAGSVED